MKQVQRGRWRPCATLSSCTAPWPPSGENGYWVLGRYYDAWQWQQEAARLDAGSRRPVAQAAPSASPAASSGGGGSGLGGAPAGAKRKSTVGPAAARNAQAERQVRRAILNMRNRRLIPYMDAKSTTVSEAVHYALVERQGRPPFPCLEGKDLQAVHA